MLVELLRNKNSPPYDLYKEIISHYRDISETFDLRAIELMKKNCPKFGYKHYCGKKIEGDTK